MGSKINYKPRYVPGSWDPLKRASRMDKSRYIPGSWKGTKVMKVAHKYSYMPRYVPGSWKGAR